MTPQNARAMSGVQPALNGRREPLMIFTLNFSAPRLWMNTQPCFPFRLPLSALAMRHSVGASECNEINCAFLLPMRQAIRRETNVCVRIEEAQFAHRSLSVSKQRSLRKLQKLRVGCSRRGGFQSAVHLKDGGLETAAPWFTAAGLPIRRAAVRINATCSLLAPMRSCPHLPLLMFPVEISSRRNAEN